MRLPLALSRRALLAGAVLAGLAALLAALLVTQLGGPSRAGAADHRDAPGLTPPGGDVRADINDIYVFAASNPSRTAIVLTVNGLTAADTPAFFGRAVPGVGANKRILYFIHVDNDGDALADVTYRLRFGKPRNGVQNYELRRNGQVLIPLRNGRTTRFDAAPRSNSGGGARLFAGVSEDPFYFDLPGFINLAKGLDAIGLDDDPTNNAESFIGCTEARPDFFAGLNVSSIVLEVPDSQLTAGGTGNTVGIWATTTIGGQQVDRMGRPAIATVFIPNNPFEAKGTEPSMKNTYNKTQPSQQRAKFRGEVVDTLQVLFSLNDAAGDNKADDAGKISGLANVLLPDILTFDTAKSQGFLNGRRPADDVIDAELDLITEGAAKTDCVDKNDKSFASAFPYLAGPHS